jgi:hypothetical protein
MTFYIVLVIFDLDLEEEILVEICEDPVAVCQRVELSYIFVLCFLCHSPMTWV